MVDCEKCAHYEDNNYCEECEYYDRDLYDHYEEATAEMITKREEEARLRAEKEAINEWISVEISDKFRDVFTLAKKCTAEIHFRKVFLGVYISPDGCLIASDTRQIVEIPCEFIPEQLLGKCVVKIEENQAGIHTEKKFPPFKHLFDLEGEYWMAALNEIQFSSPALSLNEVQYYNRLEIEPEMMSHMGFETLFQKKYLDLMREVMKGNIVVNYIPEKPLNAVVFAGNNAKMIIMPLRRSMD